MSNPSPLKILLAATGYSPEADRNRLSLQEVIANTDLPASVRHAAETALAELPAGGRTKIEAIRLLKQAIAQLEGESAAPAPTTAKRERLSAAEIAALDEAILSLVSQGLNGLSVSDLAAKTGRKKLQVDNRIEKLLAAGRIQQVKGTGTAGKGNPSRFVKA